MARSKAEESQWRSNPSGKAEGSHKRENQSPEWESEGKQSDDVNPHRLDSKKCPRVGKRKKTLCGANLDVWVQGAGLECH